ncbi:MAG: hypothetical protein ISS48_03010 [Candidatus Aenigmarchaeota archaeon]|nr:hypothetical protein [Candidatus Aenigmarchaeota archaeon]
MERGKKDKTYNIVFVCSNIPLLIVLWYLFTNFSVEYATKAELYVAIIGIMTGFSGMLWSIWSKLTDLSMKIGEICGKLNVPTKKRRRKK